MVIKICKICGKDFEARGSAKCCSPEQWMEFIETMGWLK